MDEVIEAVTSGSAGDIFQSFDLRLGGVIQVPRKTRKFFEITVSFLIGGLLHVEFCKSYMA